MNLSLNTPGTTTCFGGLISVGKSTFIQRLVQHSKQMRLDCHVMPELLTPSLCQQLPKTPIIFDAFMFGHRIQMSIDAKQIARSFDLVFMERCFIDHLAFMDAMVEIGWADSGYAEMCRSVVRELAPPVPDRFVFLDVPAKVAFERMLRRREARDTKFTMAFFETLRLGYLKAIDTYCSQPIILDWNNFGNEVDIEEFVRQLINSDLMLLHLGNQLKPNLEIPDRSLRLRYH